VFFLLLLNLEHLESSLLGEAVRDKSGNLLKKDFAALLCGKIKEDFKKHDMICTLKYMDPSYQIRSIPANADDSYYCVLLASSAVHAAMAGFTGFLTLTIEP